MFGSFMVHDGCKLVGILDTFSGTTLVASNTGLVKSAMGIVCRQSVGVFLFKLFLGDYVSQSICVSIPIHYLLHQYILLL